MQLITPPSSPRPGLVLTPSIKARRPAFGGSPSVPPLPPLQAEAEEAERCRGLRCSAAEAEARLEADETAAMHSPDRARGNATSWVSALNRSPPRAGTWVPPGAAQRRLDALTRQYRAPHLAAVAEAEIMRRRRSAKAVWAMAGVAKGLTACKSEPSLHAGGPRSGADHAFAGRGLTRRTRSKSPAWS